MRQGELWYADLNPTKGSEQAGKRPVLVVSGNMLNENLPLVIIMPLTSKVKHYKGNPILEPSKDNGLKQRSEVLVFHIRSISRDRLVQRAGQVAKSDLELALKTLGDLMRY